MPDNTIGPCLEIESSRDFSQVYPGASAGVLVLENVRIESHSVNLDSIKQKIVLDLQKEFPDLLTLNEHPVIKAYSSYYKKFRKSYHLIGQIESVIYKNRLLPSGSAILETIFALELKNLLLTAIHDLDTLQFPLEIGISSGEEIYTTLRGIEQRLKPGDMATRDQAGIISSVIYGPDQRTCIRESTSRVLIVVYAPEGIGRETINNHFEDIKRTTRSFAPQSIDILQEIYPKV